MGVQGLRGQFEELMLSDDDRKIITRAVQDGVIRALAMWTLIAAVVGIIVEVIAHS